MKYLKYIILVLVIIIIIIIAIILNIMNGENYIITDEIEEEYNIETNRIVSNVSARNNYYTVKNIVENYYYDLTQFNMSKDDIWVFETDDDEERVNSNTLTQNVETEKQAYRNKVYNYLNQEYIDKNNVNLNNLQEKLGNYNDVVVIIENMYVVGVNENVNTYFVYGNVVEKTTLKKNTFSIMVNVDSQNGAFEIYPHGHEYKVELGQELIIDIKEVQNKVYNQYKYEIISDETYCIDMLKDYTDKLIYDANSAYNSLNNEYKNAKFGSVIEFEKCIKDNYYELISVDIESYQKTKTDEYTQYLLIDRKGNYYIFRETSPMQYTLILDTYTIDIPEFTAKYQEATDQERVILNINKFMLAINDKDYKYTYSVLADSFKTSNFPTIESFETYMKANFFSENKFDYIEFRNEGGTYYTYKVKVTDASGNSDKTIEKKFIMLLGEETEFVLSFNLQ